MNRDILHYQNRIDTMSGRAGRENGNIIKKCKRKIAQLKAKESK